MEQYKLIEDMKAHIFIMAMQKWKITGAMCAEIFEKNRIFEFIEECYDNLHLQSYNVVLKDVEKILQNTKK